MRHLSVMSLAAMLLTGCATASFDAGRTEAVLPVSRAWIEGRIVEYVTTDISEAGMARMMGANHVPRLSLALGSLPGTSLVERVYKFPKNEQISVFQSAPSPVGADNQDRNYSPLWRVVMVNWQAPAVARELKSEEEILAAEERREVVLEVTDIVVNCPVVRADGGQSLTGVR